MRSKNRTRLLALLLTVAILSSLMLPATANIIPGDINGDQKITIFDAQMLVEVQAGLRTLTAAQKEASGKTSMSDIVKIILGTIPGALDTNGDGILEIYTASGLEYMAENTGNKYILMNNINLENTDWTPIANFTGTFDGNGHTISNVTIQEHAIDTNNATVENMGFFADTAASAVIKNLNLKNVTVTATAEAEYIGMMVGSLRGKVENCNVTGTIIDNRQTHEFDTYIGVMAGRICTPAEDAATGSVIGGTSISITDTAGAKTTSGLCANAKLLIANDENVHTGLCGYRPSYAKATGLWADTSNSYTLMSKTIQARRDEVVRYMNEMGTILWTPSETLKYTDARNSTATYSAGKIYRGLPYNHKNGSLERFLSVMASSSNGVYTTQKGLGNSVITNNLVEGFVQYMGNDCADAIAQAWQRVSPVQVTDGENHHPPYHGGAFVYHTSLMLPDTVVRNNYGIYQVGDWSSFSVISSESGMRVSAQMDLSEAAYVCTDVTSSKQILEENGAEVIYEAYAKASKGDAIVAYAIPWGDGWDEAGHSRMLTADPIVIRDKDGKINTEASYMVTTEQGGGGSSGDGWKSTWRVDYVYSFKTLLDDSAESGSTGYYRTYVPVTMRALHDENIRVSYINNYPGENAVVAPNQGKIFSNYRILSTTVTVKNGNKVVYQNEIFAGVGPAISDSSNKINTVDLSVHTDAFAAAARKAGLTAGGSYTFTVEVLLGDGTTHTSVSNKTFTYNP